jgi:hypothetical protein
MNFRPGFTNYAIKEEEEEEEIRSLRREEENLILTHFNSRVGRNGALLDFKKLSTIRRFVHRLSQIREDRAERRLRRFEIWIIHVILWRFVHQFLFQNKKKEKNEKNEKKKKKN